MLSGCIFVPNFPIQAFLRAHPAMRENSIGILDGVPPQQKVIAINPKAAALGVDVAFTKQQAENLGATLYTRSEVEEDSSRTALLNCSSLFSPRVQHRGRDTFILDLDGLGSLLGTPQQIAAKIHQALFAEGFDANVAIANNPDTAIIAAHGFSGVAIITNPTQLGGLSVTVLQPDADLLETVELWGIKTLRQFAALDPVAIKQRLGKEGLRLHSMARGEQVSMFAPYQPKQRFHESVPLEHPIELLPTLCFVLQQSLERICARLEEYSLRTNRLDLELLLDSPHVGENLTERKLRHRRTIRLSTPMLDLKHFVRLLELDLQAHPPAAPVAAVSITAEAAEPQPVQECLFAPPRPEPQRLQVLLTRLKNLLGETEVGCPIVLDSHRPAAFQVGAFSPPNDSDKISSRYKRAISMRRFDPPRQAQITFRSGNPIEVRFDLRCGRVVNCGQPLVISGDWWNDCAWRRKEWDVNLLFVNGALERYRIYLDLTAGRGFVFGSYD
jgi:protein ImuB